MGNPLACCSGSTWRTCDRPRAWSWGAGPSTAPCSGVSASRGWQVLGVLGTYCLDNPAGSMSGTTLTVACQGQAHDLWYATAPVTSTAVGTASAWTSLGGQTQYGPAIAVTATGTTVFVAGKNNNLYRRTI